MHKQAAVVEWMIAENDADWERLAFHGEEMNFPGVGVGFSSECRGTIP